MIPRIIHHIVGPKRNELIDLCLKSWDIVLQAGYSVKIWNDDSLGEFLLEHHHFSYNAFINSRNHAEAADIARYLLIYSFGGHYADWDVELIDLDGFLALSEKYSNGYMLVDPANGSIASEYFCSNASDPYLINIVKDIVELFDNGERENFRTPQYSGPFRMRESLLRHPETHITSIPILEAFAFLYSEIANPPKRKITQPLIHYWLHSWM